MRFASLLLDGQPRPALLVPSRGWLPLAHVRAGVPDNLLSLVQQAEGSDLLARIEALASSVDDALLISDAQFATPYTRPRKIWGIGLNYREHASDLSAEVPVDRPASFIKADHTVIGPHEQIVLPHQSARVTAEAELGLVIGRYCHRVSEEEALSYLFGFCSILDQTAEDILEVNPRYLTLAKNFPSFFAFGPEIVTADELLSVDPTLGSVRVTTVLNQEERRTNLVSQMTHSPAKLISFHSQVMPFYPGDIISSGTPGAVVVSDGDVVESRVTSLMPLVIPVVQAEKAP